MNKKGIAFLSLSAFILILSIYMQVYIVKNDVRTLVEQSRSQYEEGTNTTYREIPFVVNKKSALYITYDSTIVGENTTLLIEGEDSGVHLKELGREISLYKKKVVLDKGKYKFLVNCDNVTEIKHSFKIIYRKEEVNLINDSMEDESI